MSSITTTYNTTVRRIRDADGDEVDVHLHFTQEESVPPLSLARIVHACAYDSKGRYFYANRMPKPLAHYMELFEERWKDICVTYGQFEGCLAVFVEGGVGEDVRGLKEDVDSPEHLQSFHAHMRNMEQMMDDLRKQRTKLAKKYRGLWMHG